MPQETDRLKLPLPLGNENVTRESINGIFEKIDAGVATEREVRDAHELASSKQNIIKLANNFAAPDTAITAYPEGYSVFYVGGGTGGQGGVWRTTVGGTEAFGYVETVRVGTGGYQTFTEMYSGSDPANQAYNKQYKRNKRDSNTTWQPFERVLDIDDYNAIVSYVDNSFRKPSEMIQANIIKNSTAAQGFNYWNAVSGPWNAYLNQYVGSYFAISGIAVSDVDYLLLENEAVGVSPGAQYLLQAVLHSGGSYANSRIYVEIYNPATGAPIDSVQADNQKWWHRKTKVVTIPAGVSAVKLRLVVNNVPANMTAGFSRIMFTEGTLDVPYSQEMDIRALYEQTEAAKQSGVSAKQGIVDAINAKGGSASTSDSWATLAAKINAINTGKRFATGQLTISSNGGQGSVTGLAFRPRNIIISNASNVPSHERTFFLVYSADAPRNDYTTNSPMALNRLEGFNTYVGVNNAIFPNDSGFSVSAGSIDATRTYNYFATE